jgi:hypothetical protein
MVEFSIATRKPSIENMGAPEAVRSSRARIGSLAILLSYGQTRGATDQDWIQRSNIFPAVALVSRFRGARATSNHNELIGCVAPTTRGCFIRRSAG